MTISSDGAFDLPIASMRTPPTCGKVSPVMLMSLLFVLALLQDDSPRNYSRPCFGIGMVVEAACYSCVIMVQIFECASPKPTLLLVALFGEPIS